MLKNITFSAEEELILKARDMVMESMDYAVSGRKFSRDEMNER